MWYLVICTPSELLPVSRAIILFLPLLGFCTLRTGNFTKWRKALTLKKQYWMASFLLNPKMLFVNIVRASLNITKATPRWTITCAQSMRLWPMQSLPKQISTSNVPLQLRFAWQVHYPANPMQPGLIYFKVPRSFQNFGVHAERISK